MVENLVKCVFKDCAEIFCVEISDSLWMNGDTYVFGCPKCGKSLAFDLEESEPPASTPVVGTEILKITIKDEDSRDKIIRFTDQRKDKGRLWMGC
jgi:hypothetical protein